VSTSAAGKLPSVVMMSEVTIVLVDDHMLVREALGQLLSVEPDFRVVGQTGDSEHALELISRLRPQCVLLDVEMPGGDVVETVARIRHLTPNVNVLILSMYDDPRLVRTLLALGVRGYLLKSVGHRELVNAIRAVIENPGRVVLSVSPHGLGITDQTPPVLLSQQEQRILTLTAQALSNAQIGRQLNLKEATVKRHLHNAFTKLGAVSRIDAVNKAVAKGLISSAPGQRAVRH
jgi:DNA-binding NarL/FixJ family response regulator